MKRLLFLALALTMLSCEKDEIKDCNCDRVVEVNVDINDPVWFYTTKNECTGVVKFVNCDPNNHPNVGDCK